MRSGLAAALLLCTMGEGLAQGPGPSVRGSPAHPCASDAIVKAELLLKLHFDNADRVENLSVDKQVRVLPPIRALKGTGRFDVLEVWGHIYKADYRMRFIYAQIPGSCALMGQEILEASDPY